MQKRPFIIQKRPCFGFAIAAVGALGLPFSAATAQTAVAAAGDPVAGARTFGQCRVCHADAANAPDGVGPNLFGVYNSRAGSRRTNYAYSPQLKNSKLAWNDATLDRWLTNPATTVPGTKMTFIGLPRKPMRDNVIAYLKTLK